MKVLWVPESPESRVPFFEGAAGLEYFSWSHGAGSQSLSRSLERPMNDNLGRGPHLLVIDGEPYYTVWDGAIEEHIDVIQETKTVTRGCRRLRADGSVDFCTRDHQRNLCAKSGIYG